MKEGESVLVIGSGAREHALGWKISQSPHVGQIFFAPGNGGTATLAHAENISINPDEPDGIKKLVEFASTNRIGLTVVGPEAPLVAGIADRFNAENLRIFGPGREAARLEGRKDFAANFMRRNGIPQPRFELASNINQVLRFIENSRWDFVVKATGLAAGKGVALPETRDEAVEFTRRIFAGEFGPDQQVLFQQRLYGREISLIALVGGVNLLPLVPARDYKRLNDNDQGPNTGGMGAIAGEALLSPKQMDEAKKRILTPLMRGLEKERILFEGAIYVQLMITQEGLKVVEFNVRFGDPETEAQMELMSPDVDFYELLRDCADGELWEHGEIKFDSGFAVSVVLAAKGYPGKVRTGAVIKDLEKVRDKAVIFHGATAKKGEEIVTNGGRVLTVAAKGRSLEEVRDKVYSTIGPRGIHFSGMQYRKDIGL